MGKKSEAYRCNVGLLALLFVGVSVYLSLDATFTFKFYSLRRSDPKQAIDLTESGLYGQLSTLLFCQ
jgi:hypothetical protein